MAGVQQHLHSPAFDGSSALKLLQSGTPAEESPQQQGVRRALLTSCLALCCPSEVCTVQLPFPNFIRAYVLCMSQRVHTLHP